MKKIVKVIGVTVVVLLISFIVFIPIVNDYSATKIKNDLKEIPLPPNTEFVDAVSRAGKMTGNGNGMQYLGVMLIRSELSLEELDNYYSTYRVGKWDCLVATQEGQEIEIIEHGELLFDVDMVSDEKYYIVYTWGNGIIPFSEFDVRGN